MCDKTIEVAKAVPTKTISIKNFYILLAISSITTALVIAASIYCYQIKHQSKQKHLLPYDTSNKSKEININNMIQK